METKWRVLDRWCRELRGVVDAVPATAHGDNAMEWELRVVLPRASGFSLQRWRRRSQEPTPTYAKVVAIREALELLVIVRAIDERAWTWLLVHGVGVGVGNEVTETWTDDVRIATVVRVQPTHGETVGDVLDGVEQCRHLLMAHTDDSQRSKAFRDTKNRLLAMKRAISSFSGSTNDRQKKDSAMTYRVKLGNWISPRAEFSTPESDKVCAHIFSMLQDVPSMNTREKESCTSGEDVAWVLESVDLHMIRTVLSLDVAMGLLDLRQTQLRLEELWIDLCDRAPDHLTSSGTANLLKKIITSPLRPRHLRVDCEDVAIDRLRAVMDVLDSFVAPSRVSLDCFGMAIHSRNDRSEHFHLLGRLLARGSFDSLSLEMPNLNDSDLVSIEKGFHAHTALPSKASDSIELSLVLDRHRESWPACASLLKLVGAKVDALELNINGGLLSESNLDAILGYTRLHESLHLHQVQLSTRNPLREFLSRTSTKLRSLNFSKFHAPPQLIIEFAAILANRERCPSLESVHFDLSELVNVGDNVVRAFTYSLRRNPYIQSFHLTLDADTAAAISDKAHDDFFLLHNRLLLQPLPKQAKAAFLSVVAAQHPTRQLSQLPLLKIFEYSSTTVRRRVSIREPGGVY